MKLSDAIMAVAGVALLSLSLVGCGSPTLHAHDVEVNDNGREYNAIFVDDDGDEILRVRVVATPFPPSGDVTEIAVYVDHRAGTKLDSLEFAFESQRYTGVYLEPQDRWPDNMEFMQTADGSVLTIPEIGDIGVNSVLYRFLVLTAALDETPTGKPLRVTFVLDGARRTASFALDAPPPIARFLI